MSITYITINVFKLGHKWTKENLVCAHLWPFSSPHPFDHLPTRSFTELDNGQAVASIIHGASQTIRFARTGCSLHMVKPSQPFIIQSICHGLAAHDSSVSRACDFSIGGHKFHQRHGRPLPAGWFGVSLLCFCVSAC